MVTIETMRERGIAPIWLASYPRSGNTFLRMLLERVFGRPTYSAYNLVGQSFVDASSDPLDMAPQLPPDWQQLIRRDADAIPILVKTHDAPIDEGPAIYVVRNGASAVESYYHYHQSFAFEQPDRLEIIVGACQFGDWSSHVAAWAPESRSGALLLRYENMVNEPEAAISQLAAFLGTDADRADLPQFSELHRKFPDFFRKGKTTSPFEAWTTTEQRVFASIHGELMRHLGYADGELPCTVEPEDLKLIAAIARNSHAKYLDANQKVGRLGATLERYDDAVGRFRGSAVMRLAQAFGVIPESFGELGKKR